MRASHEIISAKSILGKENSQCKGSEADGDWLALRNSEEAGVAKSRVSKRSLVHAGPFWPSTSLAFVLNEMERIFSRWRQDVILLLPGGRKPQTGEKIGTVV